MEVALRPLAPRFTAPAPHLGVDVHGRLRGLVLLAGGTTEQMLGHFDDPVR